MWTLALLSTALWIIAEVLVFLGTYKAWAHFEPSEVARTDGAPKPRAISLEPVSILKPVKGNEKQLEKNLESFFHLDYPIYELLFSIAEADDPARPVIEKLIRRHPKVSADLVIGAVQVGPNPKVNNLVRGYARAKYDWILISDSNVRVAPFYLKQMTQEFTSDVGVVTAVVAGCEAESWGGRLEEVFLNTFYARWMFIAASVGEDCVVGKSMLFRKSTAERFGGILQLGRFLAEDYMAGRAMRMLGLKIKMLRAPIRQPLGRYAVSDFWRRHLRWGRIRKAQAPVPVFFEPWVGMLPSGLLAAFAMKQFFGVSFAVVFGVHAFAWLVCDLFLVDCLGESADGRWIVAWCLRESLAVPLWIHMWCGNSVMWRGTKLRVKPGGLLETIEESAAS